MKRFFISRLSLRTRLLLLTDAILGVVLAFISLVLPARIESQGINAAAAKAEGIASMIGFAVAPAILFEDSVTLRESLEAALANDDIVLLVVSDDEGVIRASYGLKTPVLDFGGDSTGWVERAGQGGVYKTSAAIVHRGSVIGTVNLGLSLKSLEQETYSTRVWVGSISAFLFFWGSIAIIWVSRWTTKPLHRIAESARSISEGDLSRRAPITTTDEVGQLGEAFNIMVEKLVRTQDEMRSFNERLEARVEMRTGQLKEEMRERDTERRLLRAVVDSLPDRIYFKDASGRYILNNEAHIRSMGRSTQQEMTGKRGSAFVVADWSQEWERDDADVLLTGKPYLNKETSHILPTGERERLLTSRVPLRNAAGEMLGLVVVCRDMTELYRLEESVREREEKLSNIVNHSSNLFYSHDSNNVITFISPQCRAMLDCEPAEAMVNWTNFLSDHPENKAAVETTVKALTTGVAQPPYEIELVGMKGRRLWVEVREVPVIRDGKVRGMVGSLTDVTHRRRYESTLAIFSKLGQTLNTAQSYNEAARVIADAADELFRWDACTIDLIEEETNTITSILNVDFVGGEKKDIPSVLDGGEPTPRMRRILVSGPELLCRKSGEGFSDEGIPFGNTSRPSMSLMFAPINAGSASIGVISVQSYAVNKFDKGDLASLQSLAGYCSGALQRIRQTIALSASEQKYRDIFELAPLGAYRSSRDGLIQAANGALASILGYDTTGDLSARRMEDFYFDAADREKLIQRFESRGGARSVEVQWKKKSGEPVWIELSSYARKDSNGATEYFEGFVNDITERKRAEALLHESKEMYRQLVENIEDIYYISDARGRVVYGSPNLYLKTGYTKEELEGKSVWTLVAPVDRQRVSRHYAEFAAGSETDTRCEFRARRKNGSDVWIEQTTRAIRQTDQRQIEFRSVVRNIETRKKNEDALRLQSAALESAAVGIVIAGVDGTILWANPAFCAMSGYSAAEVLGRNPRIFKSDLQDASFYKDLWHTILSGRVWKGELVNRKRDGSTYDEHMTITPLVDEQGKIARFIAIKEDISSRVEAERKLQESQLHYRELVENISEAIFSLDQNGRIEFMSPAIRLILGISPEECLGVELAGMIRSDDRSRVEGLLSRAAKGESDFIECRMATKNGGESWVRCSVRPRSGGGQQGGTQGIISDIGQQRKAQITMEDALAWQSAVFEGSRDAVLVSDKESRFISVNSAATALTGYSRDELLRMRIPDLHDEPDLADFRVFHDRILQGEHLVTEARILRKDGTKVDTEFSNSKIVVGGKTYVHTAARDVTDRKRLESQMMRSQRLESLGTLAGGIAHDLNNVLGPIMLTFELVKDAIGDEDLKKLIRNAESSATRGKNIISQILMFARGGEEQRAPVYVKHLLREIIDIASETFPRNIEIRTSIPSDLHAVFANATHIHQVFMNLCVNARDAMPRGGMLSIEAENRVVDERQATAGGNVKPGRYVRILVRDTGIGMTKEIMERVFDPFFTTKETGKGTGLGLATVHTVVQKHGGFIDVQSAVNEGSQFTVFLPAHASSPSPDSAKKVQKRHDGKGKTILVVDDEPTVLDVIKRILETTGYRVLTASDGVEGLAIFSRNLDVVSAVVTDVMMPHMDGIAMIRAFRRLNSQVRIVVSSGMLPDAFGDSLHHSEISGMLNKPFSAGELLDKLELALSLNGAEIEE